MSVFSMIRRGRQAAKDHRAEQAKKEKSEAEKAPYKHVPRHAATDAMSGGPAGWRENDRVRILEQNRRRSALTASGFNMSGVITPVHPGMPRVHSGLSHVSYPASYASPVVHLPRNYSYSSMPPGWTPHGREMSYSPVDMGSISLKGKEVERILDSSRSSRSSSKVSLRGVQLPPVGTYGSRDASSSPVESSSNSTSSQDDLEMKPVTRHSIQVPPSASSRHNRPTSDTESIHRLHPGRSRRISDPSQSAALPPMQFGTAITTPEVFSSAASSASSVTMVPVASSGSLASKGAPAVGHPMVLKVEEEVALPQQAELVTAESSGDEDIVAAKTAAQITITPIVAPDSPTKKGRRTSKMTRFTELETIKSNSTVTIESIPPIEEKRRPISTVTALPTSFDESALPAPKEIALPDSPPASKPGKLSKSPAAGGKLVKKNRWSLRSSKTAVAV
ncbi:hypothetical protein NEMBOFW57_007473 [Staphylotrichum longicolle]|uniref:Uncharacterized protein n=1 Tax=Staphylotrichum longicolle TaxID=669026 RepID=A0AAD4EUV2_9PEZI|nr:hypothetical protein NEMBOFW57_007473 [Staphylotrichum longicolle]